MLGTQSDLEVRIGEGAISPWYQLEYRAAGTIHSSVHFVDHELLRPFYLIPRYPKESLRAAGEFMNDLKGLAGEIRAYCAHRPLTLTQSKIESYSLALADGIGVPAAAGGAYFFKELSFMFGHFAHNKFVQAGVGGPVGSEAATLLILGWAYFFLTRQYQRGSAGEGQGEEDKPMLMKKTGRLMKTAFLASLATFFLMDPPLSVTLAEQVPPAYAALIASAFSGVLHAIGTKVAQHHSNGNGNHA